MSGAELIQAGAVAVLSTVSATIAVLNLTHGTRRKAEFSAMLFIAGATWGVAMTIVVYGSR